MGLITVPQVADGDTAEASDINTPVNTIADEFNGNIDNANIKSGAAIATSKLADDAGITNAKLSTDISPAKFANPYKFSVYLNASQTLTSGTFTRIAFDTREYDTSSNVDISSTKGQFTAPVAGYYQFSFSVGWNTTASLSRVIGSIYKNGSEFKRCSDVFVSSGAAGSINGTTEMSLAANDTVSVFVDGIGAAAVLNTGAAACWFQGELKSAS